MKIVLIGFMCSGKSKVGQILAKKLNWTHQDTDEAVTQEAGSPPGDVIRTRGEAAFRELERAAVRRLANGDKCVISTGGGVPLDKENMKALSSDATVAWLKIRPETVLKRAGNLASRPLIDPANPLESVRKRLAEREAAYAVAALAVDTDNATPEQVADMIIAQLPFRP